MPTETSFVPTNLNCRDWSNVQPLVDNLLNREIGDTAALEQWLLERSDLESHIYEAYSRLQVAMTCHTDDKEKAAAFRAFTQDVLPQAKKAGFALDGKYYENEHRRGLDRTRYEVFDRNTAVDIELFRDENVPIETELDGLRQEFQQVVGAQTVEFQGKTRTMPEMGKFLEAPQRETREAAYRAASDRRLVDQDKLRGVFDTMLEKRQQVAKNAGFDNYRDYMFRRMHRFDYTPEDCARFHDAVAEHVVPLYRESNERRQALMEIPTYRPWDLANDPLGRAPLDPFGGDVRAMEEGGQQIFNLMDEQLGRLYATLRDGDSLDLETRPGKAPGGYQTVFAVSRKPFIFMNAAGLGRDLRTLLHEAGHAFHTLLGGNDPLLAYRHAPIEFCEVASMSMELTAIPYLNTVYKNPEDESRAVRVQLEGVIRLLPWVAQIDAFQHWIYTHPGHTAAEREQTWLALDERFGPSIDWTGLEDYRRESWQRQLHLFSYPFYYIEYGIAQLGALQVWMKHRQHAGDAIDSYKAALSLGGSRPLPELFEAAGIRFAFGGDTIRELANEVRAALHEIPD